jgi:hypothetical protein
MQIEIDFEVFKALTALRRNESHTYNAVIREILGLAALPSETSAADQPNAKREFRSRDLSLPDGTRLSASYKGKTYDAVIDDGRWVSETGEEYNSPSAAAKAITQNSVNGLRFWHAKRPGDDNWLTLEMLALLG